MTFVNATIKILDADAVDSSRGLPPEITVQFNPTQFQLEKSVQLAEIGIPGLDSPLLQFVRGQNERLTMELFFDTTDKGTAGTVQSVRDLTEPIHQLVKVQPGTHAPPRVNVSWASLSFDAVVESVRQTFTLFSEEGIPLRATVAVTFREYLTLNDQLANRRSNDHTRQRTVRSGDTLSGIAGEMYGMPTAWRHIAVANSDLLTSVIDLPVHAVLSIPPLPKGART
jgi:hypothetical protein